MINANVSKRAGVRPGKPLPVPEDGNLLLLIGAPRSGTTWIAKLFDSHPGVLYRHEPDTVLRDDELPVLCDTAESGRLLGRARSYLERLAEVRTLKSAGSLPHFSKNYRTPFRNLLHGASVHGVRAIQAAARGAAWSKRIAVPDLFAPGHRPVLAVIKSVSARGRIGLFARAMPQSRTIFVLRHPCGQVNSTLRGIKAGRFERRVPFEEILATPEAREAGLSDSGFRSLDLVEQCAWHWAILNQKAANDLAGLRRVMTIRYEDACSRPRKITAEMFDFAGLSGNEQTDAFVTRSTTAPDTDRYYLVTRDTLAAANRWRNELGTGDQKRIVSVARRVPVGRLFDT